MSKLAAFRLFARQTVVSCKGRDASGGAFLGPEVLLGFPPDRTDLYGQSCRAAQHAENYDRNRYR